MKNGKTIAVTGGTGHLGSALIHLLLENNYTVRSLHYRSKPMIQHHNLTWIRGDINDSHKLNLLTLGAQAVVHCAAQVSIEDKPSHIVFHTNVTGTSSIVKTCLSQNLRLIHISSSIVSQEESSHWPLDNVMTSTKNESLTYDTSKTEAEKVVLDAINTYALDAVILRPTAVVGPPDPKPSLLGEVIIKLAKGALPMLPSGGYNLIDVRDLSQTVINSISMAESGHVYSLGGSYCSIKQLAKWANPNKFVVVIPTALILTIYPVVSLLMKFSNSKLPLSKNSLKTLQDAPEMFNSKKAQAKLNHKCRPISQTVSDLLAWQAQNKHLYAEN